MSWFPAPPLGLAISDRSVEAVLVVRKGHACFVRSYGRVELMPGLVADGAIVDVNGLARALRKLLQGGMTPPLPKGVDRVVFALPDSQVHMHVFTVPGGADERALGPSLAAEADGIFPVPHEELAAAFTVLSQRRHEKDIYYAAVRKPVLESYRRLFASIGLTPAAIEPESTSIARAVLDTEEPLPTVLVDIGARTVDISVFDRDGIQHSETLPHAGDSFTQALSEAGKMPLQMAETRKRERGVSSAPKDAADRALISAVDAMLGDVEAAIAFYEQDSDRRVGKVLFCGGGALMPGLMERAAARLDDTLAGRAVEPADPWISAHPGQHVDADDLQARGAMLAIAMGLGLRGAGIRKFPEIDFLPEASRGGLISGPKPKRMPIVIGVLAVACLAAAGWFLAPRLSGWLPAASPAGTAAAPALLSVQTQATLAPDFSAQDMTLSGAPLELAFSVDETFTHAASSTPAKAKGTLAIVNGTSAARTLIATTRFLAADGTLFRLDRTTSIPADGRTEAAVTADQPGAQGEVAAGHFTIPGLPANLQAVVYGESDTAMTGGTVATGAPYTEADRAAALAAFTLKAEQQAIAHAAEKAGAGRIAPEGLVTLAPLDIQGLPQVGAPTADYELKADATAEAVALDRGEIEKLLHAALAGRLNGSASAEAYALDDVQVKVESMGSSTSTATLDLSAKARHP